MRKTLAGKPSDEQLEQAKADIQDLKVKQTNDEIDLYYFDESGFSLTPSVPYGWQDTGSRVKIDSSRSKRINVAGFLNPDKGDLISWTFECSINSGAVIEVFNQLSESIKKETWVILDNASFHCSKLISEKMSEWKKKGLFLYYLPPYSPQLNLIERVWQFMKYKWMPLSAYCSYENLKNAVNDMLAEYGNKYLITFA